MKTFLKKYGDKIAFAIAFVIGYKLGRKLTTNEAEDFIFDEIKDYGFVQLEHSKTKEPMVIEEAHR